MKKVSFMSSSILNTASFLMFVASAEASTVINENDADSIPQIQHSSTILKEQVFDRKVCYRAIARKHSDLNSFDIPEEKKFVVMFDLGKLYYVFAMNSEELDEKGGYYEKAEFYFKKSKFPEAREYLVEIIKFNYDQN